MGTIRVAGLQCPVMDNNAAANAQTIREGIRRAAAEGAHILLTPEGALSGYDFDRPFDFPAVEKWAGELAAYAGGLGVGLAGLLPVGNRPGRALLVAGVAHGVLPWTRLSRLCSGQDVRLLFPGQGPAARDEPP